MLAFLLSKIGAYLVGGVLIAALLGGVYWYVGNLQTENALLTRQLTGYKRAVEILKQDAKTDAETEEEKNRIASLAPADLPGEFKRLRDKARSSKPANTIEADD